MASEGNLEGATLGDRYRREIGPGEAASAVGAEAAEQRVCEGTVEEAPSAMTDALEEVCEPAIEQRGVGLGELAILAVNDGDAWSEGEDRGEKPEDPLDMRRERPAVASQIAGGLNDIGQGHLPIASVGLDQAVDTRR